MKVKLVTLFIVCLCIYHPPLEARESLPWVVTQPRESVEKTIRFDYNQYLGTYYDPVTIETISYRGIDYVTISSIAAMFDLLNRETVKYDYETFQSCFNIEENTISVGILPTFSPSVYFGGASQVGRQKFSLTVADYDPSYVQHTTHLDDFNVSLLRYEDATYVPVMLLNYAFLDHEFVLVAESAASYQLFTDFTSYHQAFEEGFSIYQPGDQTLALKQFTTAYLYRYLMDFYPYGQDKKEAINRLVQDRFIPYEGNDFIYYRYLDRFIDSLMDYHSAFYSGNYYYNRQTALTEQEAGLLEIDYYNSRQFRYYAERYQRPVNIKQNAFESFYLMEDIYYIYLPTFENSFEFDAIDDLIQGLDPEDRLILDLRNNGGGGIYYFVQLLKNFTSDPITIPFMYKDGGLTGQVAQFEFQKRGDAAFQNDLVVLTNGQSYSATNMFVSIVKNHNIGTVIGEATLGGGSAREAIVLPNSGFLDISSPKLSVLDKNGSSIENGVEPDIYVGDRQDGSQGQDEILKAGVEYLLKKKTP